MSPSYYVSPELRAALIRWRRRALTAAGVLLALSILTVFANPDSFFRAYLVGFLYALAAALGSMAFVMLQYLTGGAWGVVSRRVFEAASRTLPVLAILFVPVLVGIPFLYPWANPDAVQHSEVMRHRSWYMNPAMFVARSAVYLAIWMLIAHFLNRWSVEEDLGSVDAPRRLPRLSAPGLIVYVFTITFAVVDWAGSLQTEWYSTIWGFIFVANQGLTAMALAIVALWLLGQWEPLSGVLRPAHFHALGKLLLMMVLLWAYVSYSQLLIVWAGNLPHEISYYLPRWGPPWSRLGVALAAGQFLIPFLLLLSRPLKRNAALLSGVAVCILVIRFVDLVWVVFPASHHVGWSDLWAILTAPVGVVLIWLWAFLGELIALPLLPVNAPEFEEALIYESH